MRKLFYSAVSSVALYGAVAAAQGPDFDSTVDIQTLNDPSLIALVREVLSSHPEVQAAQAGVDADRARVMAADRPLFNPEIITEFASSDSTDRIVGLSQTLDRANSRDARTAVAESEQRVAMQRLSGSRRDIAVELLVKLAEYETAATAEELALLRVDLMERFADIARQRQAAGDLAQTDLNLANLANAQAQIERARAASDSAAARQALQALMLRPVGETFPELPSGLPPIELSDAALNALVNAVPEVRVQRVQVEVAEAEVELADRERRANPTLTLSGGEEDGDSTVGLSFSMPLNVRNRFVYEVTAARATREQEARQLDNLMVRARARLEASTQSYSLIRMAWQQWLATGQPNLTQQTDLLDRLWRAGELGATEYLVQLNQTLDTQSTALELRQSLWIAWLEWLASAGQVGAWLGLPVETN